jgi:hypothetical protein
VGECSPAENAHGKRYAKRNSPPAGSAKSITSLPDHVKAPEYAVKTSRLGANKYPRSKTQSCGRIMAS